VELLVDAVATPWSGGATWTSPWIRPGGDVVGSLGGGGGGGGGCGRIHVNLPSGAGLPGTLQLSGVVTQGALDFD